MHRWYFGSCCVVVIDTTRCFPVGHCQFPHGSRGTAIKLQYLIPLSYTALLRSKNQISNDIFLFFSLLFSKNVDISGSYTTFSNEVCLFQRKCLCVFDKFVGLFGVCVLGLCFCLVWVLFFLSKIYRHGIRRPKNLIVMISKIFSSVPYDDSLGDCLLQC